MKRFGLAALFAIGVALFSCSPARAQTTLMNTGVEPSASGQATLTKVKFLYALQTETMNTVMYKGYLTVTCQGLTPGATYATPGGTFTADRNGNGMAKGWTRFGYTSWIDEWGNWVPADDPWVDVVRLNRDGSTTLVLTGPWPL
jgi:hypothetical protein